MMKVLKTKETFNQSEPLVSIVVPVYNGSDYLPVALESLQKQTYKKIEIIIVNDGSTDSGKTENCIIPFLKDKRFKYFFKENGGVGSALNFGISKSQGDYICWLSHDDYYPKTKIEIQVSNILHLIEKGVDINKTIFYSKFVVVDENGKKYGGLKQLLSHVPNKKYRYPFHYFSIKNVFYGTLILPRDFLINHPFLSELRYSQDRFSFFQMLENGYRIVFCKKAFAFYRIHRKQGSFTRIEEYNKDLLTMDKLFEHYFSASLDTKFYKKYFFYLAKKSGNNRNIYELYKQKQERRKTYKITRFDIFVAKIIRIVFVVLMKIKVKVFGR